MIWIDNHAFDLRKLPRKLLLIFSVAKVMKKAGKGLIQMKIQIVHLLNNARKSHYQGAFPDIFMLILHICLYIIQKTRSYLNSEGNTPYSFLKHLVK